MNSELVTRFAHDAQKWTTLNVGCEVIALNWSKLFTLTMLATFLALASGVDIVKLLGEKRL
jgi:hypothetical protein